MVGRLCTHSVETGTGVWRCIREYHDWAHKAQATARRKAGKVPEPDRHYMVKSS